tara:strand:- start:382 stop:1074 length:693 start_codon:yes stop_codon:yes gene_type:complete
LTKYLLLLAPLILALGLPVQASSDLEVHKMCLQAADYKGCIKAQSKFSDLGERLKSRELIKDQKWKSVYVACRPNSKCHLGMIGKIRSKGNIREFDEKAIDTHFKGVTYIKQVVNCKKKQKALYIPQMNAPSNPKWRTMYLGEGLVDNDVFNYVCKNKQTKKMKVFDKDLKSLGEKHKNKFEVLKDENLQGIDLITFFYLNKYRNFLIIEGEVTGDFQYKGAFENELIDQ